MVVWFVEKDGEFAGVITRDWPDSWEMRKEAGTLVDCKVWQLIEGQWWSMPTNHIQSAIWQEGTPPPSIIMAALIGE